MSAALAKCLKLKVFAPPLFKGGGQEGVFGGGQNL